MNDKQKVGRPKSRREKEVHTTVKFHDSPICGKLNELITDDNRQAFCEALGITDRTIYHWKKGQSRPDVDKLVAIAEFFDCTVDYLLGKDTHPTREETDVSQVTGLSDVSIKILGLLVALQSSAAAINDVGTDLADLYADFTGLTDFADFADDIKLENDDINASLLHNRSVDALNLILESDFSFLGELANFFFVDMDVYKDGSLTMSIIGDDGEYMQKLIPTYLTAKDVPMLQMMKIQQRLFDIKNRLIKNKEVDNGKRKKTQRR